MPARDLVLDDALHYRSCWEESEIEQVLATLGRLDQRQDSKTLQQRRDERKPYVAPVLIAVQRQGKRSGARTLLTVVARDLSRSGMGILSPLFFEPEILDHTTPMLRAHSVFREGVVLDLGLKTPSNEFLWLYGTVLRICTVQHDFLDIGIRFNGRRNLALDFDFI